MLRRHWRARVRPCDVLLVPRLLIRPLVRRPDLSSRRRARWRRVGWPPSRISHAVLRACAARCAATGAARCAARRAVPLAAASPPVLCSPALRRRARSSPRCAPPFSRLSARRPPRHPLLPRPRFARGAISVPRLAVPFRAAPSFPCASLPRVVASASSLSSQNCRRSQGQSRQARRRR